MKTDLSDTRRLQDATAWRVLHLARRLRHSLAVSLEAWGTDLSPEQYFILFQLAEEDGRVQRDLGDPVLDDRANITRLVTALADRGLVERRADPRDARTKRVYLTEQGRDLFETLRPRIVEERRRLFADITAQQLDGFEAVLSALNAAVLSEAP